MLDSLKKFFAGAENSESVISSEERILVATCALFVEMAQIDDEFNEKERDEILEILTTKFSLSKNHATALLKEAQREADESVDLWQFTNQINEHYSREEKIQIMELLWQIVYSDGVLDKHEDYMTQKLKSLLRLDHKDFIAAKLKAQNDG